MICGTSIVATIGTASTGQAVAVGEEDLEVAQAGARRHRHLVHRRDPARGREARRPQLEVLHLAVGERLRAPSMQSVVRLAAHGGP